MTKRERQGWIIVASLFATLLLVFGSGYNTAGVFVTPLIKEFGWKRAKVSFLQSWLAASAGICGPAAGWLLDRVEARIVMVAGAAIAGLAWLLASQAHSYGTLVVAYLLMGLGLTGATLLPASLIIANWFGARRGIAMGMAFAGTSFGGAVMTVVASHAIVWGGSWRTGYLVLAVPMFILVIPIVLLAIRTRPADARRSASIGSATGRCVARFRVARSFSHALVLDAVCGAVSVRDASRGRRPAFHSLHDRALVQGRIRGRHDEHRLFVYHCGQVDHGVRCPIE